MPSGKNYLAMIKPKSGDRLDYGVRGMKWGVRRSSTELRAAAKQRQVEKQSLPTTSGATKPPAGETSSARYARLKAQSRSSKDWSDEDLKFFNARTEALAKVAKMNASKEGWFQKTAKKVLQTSAERTMQSVSDAIATKYIALPITDAIKNDLAAKMAESKTPVDYVGKHRAKK